MRMMQGKKKKLQCINMVMFLQVSTFKRTQNPIMYVSILSRPLRRLSWWLQSKDIDLLDSVVADSLIVVSLRHLLTKIWVLCTIVSDTFLVSSYTLAPKQFTYEPWVSGVLDVWCYDIPHCFTMILCSASAMAYINIKILLLVYGIKLCTSCFWSWNASVSWDRVIHNKHLR